MKSSLRSKMHELKLWPVQKVTYPIKKLHKNLYQLKFFKARTNHVVFPEFSAYSRITGSDSIKSLFVPPL